MFLQAKYEWIILTPLHPLKLIWQIKAQKMLYNAIDNKKPCPAAGILNPHSAPDLIYVPIPRPNGKDDSIPFKSIQSSSSYWGVYENANKLEFQKTVHIWDSWLGIEVNSASAGFTSQQAKKAIDDVKKIRNSKNILKIKVINDTDELSNINDGIEEWSDENIGDIEKDAWFNAGSRKLEIRDSREPIHVPHDTIISNLANNTNGLLKWYKQNKDKVNKTESDLTIVENLKQHNHKIEKNMLCNSVISRSGLLRYRLRKNNFYDSSNDNEIYIYESLSGITYSNDSLSKLIALVEKARKE